MVSKYGQYMAKSQEKKLFYFVRLKEKYTNSKFLGDLAIHIKKKLKLKKV